MRQGTTFRKLKRPSTGRRRRRHQADGAFIALLWTEVVDRFAQLTGRPPTAASVEVAAALAGSARMPLNLICADCESRERCEEPWEKHLVKLERDPETHWHRCPEGHLCGVVPVLADHVCVAALRLLCDARTKEERFQRDLALLELLAECCVLRHGDVLERTIAPLAQARADDLASAAQAKQGEGRQALHPQVAGAIAYVGRHLTDTRLSVEHIAHELEMNSTYLGHLFAQQVGVPLHRYVAARRVELAKRLLVTTNWQIKRVARESGHGSPNWFSHVFRGETGLTPTAYRRRHSA